MSLAIQAENSESSPLKHSLEEERGAGSERENPFGPKTPHPVENGMSRARFYESPGPRIGAPLAWV